MFSDYTRNKFDRPDACVMTKGLSRPDFVTFKSPFKNPRSHWHPQGSKFASDVDRLSRGVPPVREGDELRRKLEGRRILA